MPEIAETTKAFAEKMGKKSSDGKEIRLVSSLTVLRVSFMLKS